eukprot:656590-Heterocapsa_arctica.AAC.1
MENVIPRGIARQWSGNWQAPAWAIGGSGQVRQEGRPALSHSAPVYVLRTRSGLRGGRQGLV